MGRLWSFVPGTAAVGAEPLIGSELIDGTSPGTEGGRFVFQVLGIEVHLDDRLLSLFRV